MVKILYFGRLSDIAQRREDNVDLPANILNVEDLKTWLDTHHALEGALKDSSIKTMVNQKLAHENESINPEDEIGFLPPVGGG